MPVLATKLNPRSDEFKANAAAMRARSTTCTRSWRRSRRAAARRRAPSTWRAASCCRASASRCCSIPARRSSSSRRWPRTACTTATRPAPASSPASAASAGVECVIVCNDATVKGGTYYPMTVKKHLRAQEIARRTTCRASTWSTPAAPTCRTRTRCSPTASTSAASSTTRPTCRAQGIAQIAVVMGSCTAGGAYVPAMSDESIIVKNQGTIFLGGPPLVKAATGEVVSAEELGGGDVHTRLSGVADHLAAERRACAGARAQRRWRSLNRRKPRASAAREPPRAPALRRRASCTASSRPTRASPSTCARSSRASSTARELDEFKARYGTTLVSGFAHIDGIPVGIIANNGILFSESALKGAHFIELCCQRKIPLVFLQNITGFMVGRKYENGGIAKHGAKMVTAVACAQRAQVHGHHRRQLRRRQLRHVRARLLAALPVDVAQRAHLGDGRRAGGQRARHGASATASRPRAAPGAPTRRQRSSRRSSSSTSTRGTRTTRARGCGTTASSTRPTRGACWRWRSAASLNAPIPETRFGVFRM